LLRPEAPPAAQTPALLPARHPPPTQPVEEDDEDADMADATGRDQAAPGPRAPRRVLKALTPAQRALRRLELGTKALDPEFVRRYVLYVRRHRWGPCAKGGRGWQGPRLCGGARSAARRAARRPRPAAPLPPALEPRFQAPSPTAAARSAPRPPPLFHLQGTAAPTCSCPSATRRRPRSRRCGSTCARTTTTRECPLRRDSVGWEGRRLCGGHSKKAPAAGRAARRQRAPPHCAPPPGNTLTPARPPPLPPTTLAAARSR
jgi:hypothetical protein